MDNFSSLVAFDFIGVEPFTVLNIHPPSHQGSNFPVVGQESQTWSPSLNGWTFALQSC
jgi:hypothetical protein